MSTSSTVVGEIEYRVKIDTKDFKSEISHVEKTMKTELGSAGDKSGKDSGEKASHGFGEKFKNGLKNIGNGFLAGMGGFMGQKLMSGFQSAFSSLTNIFKSSISAFSDYEQLTGGVETLFKDSQNQVFQYADNAYKTAGLSANQYMETVTGFSASLLQGLKGDTAAAARYADMAVTDMSDNANKMGTDMGLIQTAYQGFAKQNYTMLDNLKLGYGGTKTEMERLLKDAEKLPQAMGKKFDISNYQDIIEAIHLVQENTGIAGTTQKEAAETISGSLGMLKGAWSNLVVGLADDTQDFGKLLNNVIESVEAVGKNLLPTIEVALGGMVQLIQDVAPLIIAEIPKLVNQLLPPVLEAMISIVMSIIEILPGLIEQLFNALVEVLPKLIDAIVTILPSLIDAITNLVITIVMKLTEPATLTMLLNGAVKLFMAIIEALPQILTALTNALPQIITNIIAFLIDPNTIAQLLSAAIILFMALVRAVPMIFGALIATLGGLFAEVWKRVSGMFSQGGEKIGQAFSNAFKTAINNVLGVVENTVNFFVDMINGVIGIINAIPGVNLGKLDRLKIPRLASGGIVPATAGGKIIMAGEAGEDEWVVPESKMASLIEKLGTGNGNGGGETFNFTFNGVVGNKSELRQCAITFHDAYEEVKKARMTA